MHHFLEEMSAAHPNDNRVTREENSSQSKNSGRKNMAVSLEKPSRIFGFFLTPLLAHQIKKKNEGKKTLVDQIVFS